MVGDAIAGILIGTGSITNIVDYGTTVAGTIKITSAGHGMVSGRNVIISDTTNYNGTYDITVIDVDNFYVTATYVADETAGTWTLDDISADVEAGRIPERRGGDWIIYNMISAVPMTVKSNYRKFIRYHFQIDIYSRTYENIDSIATEVINTLDDYTGIVEGVNIDKIIFDGENDMPVEFIYDEEAREDYFRRQQDYIINVKS